MEINFNGLMVTAMSLLGGWCLGGLTGLGIASLSIAGIHVLAAIANKN